MLIPNHPDDERLSALAARDDDAVADAALASHVSTCTRCTALVTELGALRASLSELPDLAPPRPLRLLPPVADAPASGAAGWVRRLFAPALTAGAAIAMVGLVGTAGPLLDGMASSPGMSQDVGSNLEAAAEQPGSSAAEALSTDATYGVTDYGGEPATAAGSGDDVDEGGAESRGNQEPVPSPVATEERELFQQLPAERSIWPMVLFAGIALMIGAALARWILVPRAG